MKIIGLKVLSQWLGFMTEFYQTLTQKQTILRLMTVFIIQALQIDRIKDHEEVLRAMWM